MQVDNDTISGHSIRCLLFNGKMMYHGTDVVHALGYSNATQAAGIIRKLPKECFEIVNFQDHFQKRRAYFVTKDGVKFLHFKSIQMRNQNSGVVYAFLLKWRPSEGKRILKVGKTVNWDTRRK